MEVLKKYSYLTNDFDSFFKKMRKLNFIFLILVLFLGSCVPSGSGGKKVKKKKYDSGVLSTGTGGNGTGGFNLDPDGTGFGNDFYLYANAVGMIEASVVDFDYEGEFGQTCIEWIQSQNTPVLVDGTNVNLNINGENYGFSNDCLYVQVFNGVQSCVAVELSDTSNRAYRKPVASCYSDEYGLFTFQFEINPIGTVGGDSEAQSWVSTCYDLYNINSCDANTEHMINVQALKSILMSTAFDYSFNSAVTSSTYYYYALKIYGDSELTTKTFTRSNFREDHFVYVENDIKIAFSEYHRRFPTGSEISLIKEKFIDNLYTETELRNFMRESFSNSSDCNSVQPITCNGSKSSYGAIGHQYPVCNASGGFTFSYGACQLESCSDPSKVVRNGVCVNPDSSPCSNGDIQIATGCSSNDSHALGTSIEEVCSDGNWVPKSGSYCRINSCRDNFEPNDSGTACNLPPNCVEGTGRNAQGCDSGNPNATATQISQTCTNGNWENNAGAVCEITNCGNGFIPNSGKNNCIEPPCSDGANRPASCTSNDPNASVASIDQICSNGNWVNQTGASCIITSCSGGLVPSNNGGNCISPPNCTNGSTRPASCTSSDPNASVASIIQICSNGNWVDQTGASCMITSCSGGLVPSNNGGNCISPPNCTNGSTRPASCTSSDSNANVASINQICSNGNWVNQTGASCMITSCSGGLVPSNSGDRCISPSECTSGDTQIVTGCTSGDLNAMTTSIEKVCSGGSWVNAPGAFCQINSCRNGLITNTAKTACINPSQCNDSSTQVFQGCDSGDPNATGTQINQVCSGGQWEASPGAFCEITACGNNLILNSSHTSCIGNLDKLSGSGMNFGGGDASNTFSGAEDIRASNFVPTFTSQSGQVVIEGSTGYESDTQDYFYFSAQSNGELEVLLDDVAENMNLRAYENILNNEIGSSIGKGMLNLNKFTVSAGNNYYINIQPIGTTKTNYTLILNFEKDQDISGGEIIFGNITNGNLKTGTGPWNKRSMNDLVLNYSVAPVQNAQSCHIKAELNIPGITNIPEYYAGDIPSLSSTYNGNLTLFVSFVDYWHLVSSGSNVQFKLLCRKQSTEDYQEHFKATKTLQDVLPNDMRDLIAHQISETDSLTDASGNRSNESLVIFRNSNHKAEIYGIVGYNGDNADWYKLKTDNGGDLKIRFDYLDGADHKLKFELFGSSGNAINPDQGSSQVWRTKKNEDITWSGVNKLQADRDYYLKVTPENFGPERSPYSIDLEFTPNVVYSCPSISGISNVEWHANDNINLTQPVSEAVYHATGTTSKCEYKCDESHGRHGGECISCGTAGKSNSGDVCNFILEETLADSLTNKDAPIVPNSLQDMNITSYVVNPNEGVVIYGQSDLPNGIEDDLDSYLFEAPEDGDLTVELSNFTSDLDLYLSNYEITKVNADDPNDTPLNAFESNVLVFSRNDGLSSEKITHFVHHGGKVLISVGIAYATPTSYMLKVSFSPKNTSGNRIQEDIQIDGNTTYLGDSPDIYFSDPYGKMNNLDDYFTNIDQENNASIHGYLGRGLDLNDIFYLRPKRSGEIEIKLTASDKISNLCFFNLDTTFETCDIVRSGNPIKIKVEEGEDYLFYVYTYILLEGSGIKNVPAPNYSIDIKMNYDSPPGVAVDFELFNFADFNFVEEKVESIANDGTNCHLILYRNRVSMTYISTKINTYSIGLFLSDRRLNPNTTFQGIQGYKYILSASDSESLALALQADGNVVMYKVNPDWYDAMSIENIIVAPGSGNGDVLSAGFWQGSEHYDSTKTFADFRIAKIVDPNDENKTKCVFGQFGLDGKNMWKGSRNGTNYFLEKEVAP
ncbi:MAG: hypothetical protein H6622_06345 [Halobacteriovoraceae bacterium]|nr:hypothetical protein [Halobacteriovoraceae bacterium]